MLSPLYIYLPINVIKISLIKFSRKKIATLLIWTIQLAKISSKKLDVRFYWFLNYIQEKSTHTHTSTGGARKVMQTIFSFNFRAYPSRRRRRRRCTHVLQLSVEKKHHSKLESHLSYTYLKIIVLFFSRQNAK